MATFDVSVTVGRLVAERPSRSRIFERLGIDYCCGGKRPLAEACADRGLSAEAVLAAIAAADASSPVPEADWSSMPLAALADHVEQTHHAWLRTELPRLALLAGKVERAHGGRDPRLAELAAVLARFVAELGGHMREEERVLFPVCRAAGAPGDERPADLAGLVVQLESEHHAAARDLEAFRRLTDGFVAPVWACNTYRALLVGLQELERDMHAHVHKESSILFPRLLARDDVG